MIGEWNGLKCSSCDNWIPISEYEQPLEIECCDNPNYNQHETPVVSLEEIRDKIQVKTEQTEERDTE